MRIGVVTPGTDRGLGIQTWEAARHLDADVLLVDCKDPRFPTHHERFPGATVARWAQGIDHRVVLPWLKTVDVVYSAETFFDPRFCDWATAAGTRTVLHANPEFWTGVEHPTDLWSATPWRRDTLPPAAQVVLFPVATDRIRPNPPHRGATRWLHVAGKRALADRNGTDVVLAALRYLQEPCTVTVVVQHGETPTWPEVPPHVKLRFMPPPHDYWDLYPGHDALVLPRRYGGLCLPAQEAMAAGLALVMTELPPNDIWPGPRVPVEFDHKERMPCGVVPVYRPDVMGLARTMDRLADPVTLAAQQTESLGWAETHSWEALGPSWLERMASEVAA